MKIVSQPKKVKRVTTNKSMYIIQVFLHKSMAQLHLPESLCNFRFPKEKQLVLQS